MKINFIYLVMLFAVLISCKKERISSYLNPGRENGFSEKSIQIDHPIDFCNQGNPIGGGEGYSANLFRRPNITISTNISAVDFKTLIESATNQYIYIEGNVVIDLTGLTSTINLPQGIIIGSNRGYNGSQGALIKTDDTCPYGSSCIYPESIFLSAGNNIRFTGVRIRGPYGMLGDANAILSRTGITMKGHSGLEVDNCELTQWSEAAIYIGRIGAGNESNSNNLIHHNYFGYNMHKGLGYGVCVDNGYVVVKCNIFEKNRHDIACSGYRNTNNTGYEAACNIVLDGGVSHNFDVHGYAQDLGPNASTFFYIHHNYFIDKGDFRYDTATEPKQNIFIRGIPDNQCRIENNVFRQDGPWQSIGQDNHYGNLLAWNNVYGYGLNGGSGSYLGWYVKPNWVKKGVSNFMDIQSTNTTLLSSIGNPSIIDYALGDANGDGKTDIYKLENGILYTLPYEITNGLTQTWTAINATGYLMNQMRFGHYNSDNITDVIVKDGNNIYVSYSCTGSWTNFGSSTYPLQSIYSGDLTGDGIEDFFLANGANFLMVDNSVPGSSWQVISSSTYTNNSLKLGWFDLNTSSAKIDVLLADGSNFYSAYDGIQSWLYLTSTGYVASQLRVYDFDSDGVSDVLNNNSPKQVSLKGRNSWANCTLNNFPLSTFTYGDF